MTCIIGIRTNDKVFIGGDSAGVAGYSISTRADQKVFKNGEFIFGFTSSFRMGQILEYKFTPPPRHPETPIYKYMVTDFVDGIRAMFKDCGYMRKNNEVEQGGSFLVGVENRLFQIASDFQVAENIDPYNATGCGEDIAFGALHVLKPKFKTDEDIHECLMLALEAAAYHSAGVRGPFTIVQTL